jgi:hypothetical protein
LNKLLKNPLSGLENFPFFSFAFESGFFFLGGWSEGRQKSWLNTLPDASVTVKETAWSLSP